VPMADLSLTLRFASSLSLYYRLEQVLHSMITAGSWSPGSLNCTERKLMQAAGVSRATVPSSAPSALIVLAQRGPGLLTSPSADLAGIRAGRPRATLR
jgi:DNA-binding transcriptional MocR family regulator